MKEFIAKYQKAIVGTGAVAVLVVCYFQQKELSNLRSERDELAKHMVNSHAMVGGDIQKVELHDSLFNLQTELGRYEVALEMFKEENPKGAEQFELIMSTKTE